MKVQTALVTGAGRGIGRAVSIALAREGVQVALVARSADELETLADEIRQGGGRADVFPADLSELALLPALVAQVNETLGSIDLLVNNAGVFIEKPVMELSVDDWERTQRVNTTAPFILCREILPLMAANKLGRIINVASTSSLQGYLNQSAYCASKHAMLGLSRVLTIEAKPLGVHVNTLCPGGVDTDLIAGTYLASRLEGQPMIRPEDIAEQVLFLMRQPETIDISGIVTRRFIP